MIPVTVLAAAILAAQANPPPGAGSATSTGTGPTVVVQAHRSLAPDGTLKIDTKVQVDDEDVSEQYGPIWPTKAYDHDISGRVVLACRINARGFAQSCDVASEAPLNMGFGEAALELQPSLRVAPPASLPPSGSVVMNIAVKFDAAQDTLDASGSKSSMPSSAKPGGGVTFNEGGRISRRTGNPIVMQSVTMMDHPIWSAAPSFDDVRRAYPASAGAVEGFVVLRCKVEHSGALFGCAVTKEEPDRQGFERAGLSLAPLFRVSPAVMAKAPGGVIQVVVPIRFAPPAPNIEPTVLSPFWLSGFDQRAALKVFPPDAVAHGLTTGRGMARCVVGADGALTACSPETADPDGVGFSEAAVVLAATMKMNLWSADAGPVRGGVIHVPIRLNLAPSR